MTALEPSTSAGPTLGYTSSIHPFNILALPPEILQHLLLTVTTPSFLQLTQACRYLFILAAKSRAVLLHHLHELPGLKIGLSDHSAVTTSELFITLRRRAAAHLYGVNFAADRTDYAFRHATLDPDASVIAEGREYINVALALKESLMVRLYGGKCVRKEVIDSPYGDGRGRILKILQWSTKITVLYGWIDEDEDMLSGGATSIDPMMRRHSQAISRQLRQRQRSDSSSYAPRSNSAFSSTSRQRSRSPARKRSPVEDEPSSPLRFHLLHYNAYSFSKPAFFSIPAYKDHLVPVSVAISSRLKCAILWDREGSISPTSNAIVVLYTADFVPRGEEGVYDTRQAWPPRQLNRSDTETPVLRSMFPRRIEMFHEGHRLALYAPGQIVPYEIVSTNGSMNGSLSNTVVLGNPGTPWTIDKPFWGKHETYTEKMERDEDAEPDEEQEPEERTYCQHTYLCLGTAVVNGVKVAGILRSRARRDHDDCRHVIDCDLMPHTNNNSKVVARLWGWNESLSTLPGVVAWSYWASAVKFLAIAEWDRVLVWAVAVAELGEEFEGDGAGHEGEGSEEDDTDDGGGEGSENGDGGTDSASTVDGTQEASQKGRGKDQEEEKVQAEVKGYYERVWYENLQASIVDLKPVVLTMGGGGVIRRMVWSRHRDDDESEGEAEDSSDDDLDDPTWDIREAEPSSPAPDPVEDDVQRSEPDTRTDTAPDQDEDADASGLNVDIPYRPGGLGLGQMRNEKGKGKRKINPPGLRLKVLTDRGVSIWELGVWAKGRRKKAWLDEVVI